MESSSGSPTIEQSPTTEVVSPGSLPGADQVVLADQQLELHRVLFERSEKAAEWYRGALIALANGGNPERFVHAAHSIRELMEKLHVLIDVPAQTDKTTLKGKFKALADIWDKARASSSCNNNGAWSGPIDHHLRRGLVAVDRMIEWFRANRPSFRDVSLAVFRELDVSKRPLPSSLEARHFKEWSDLNDFFQSVSHHRHETDDAEFSARLYAFERFVLDMARPRTSEEQTLLDQLIAEAEGGS